MADDPIQLGLVALYHALAGDDDFDLNQLGDDTQADTMNIEPRVALKNLAVAVDTNARRDRFGANLAYVLAQRCINAGVGGDLESANEDLGQKIVGRFAAPDIEEAEKGLANAVARMIANPHLTTDVADFFVIAFGGSLAYVDLGHSIEFTGAAAETAAMFTDMSCMDFGLSVSSEPGTVTSATGVRTEVFKFDHEFCTSLSWDRLKVTVDPRQWPVYNPGFFHSVQVLDYAMVGSGPGWTGIVQESVGVMPTTGTPAVTNLTVTYHESKDVAITAYDLGPDVPLHNDDGRVTVDYGFFGVVDEGPHRRMRMVKVLHIDGFEKWPKWIWWLWAQQISLSGYLFEEPGP